MRTRAVHSALNPRLCSLYALTLLPSVLLCHYAMGLQCRTHHIPPRDKKAALLPAPSLGKSQTSQSAQLSQWGLFSSPFASHICIPVTKTPNRSNQRKGGGASGSSHCIVIWETTFVPWEGQETRPKPDRNQDRVAFKDSPPGLLLPSRPHSFQTVS